MAEFYKQEARLATETALVDDNGDAQGTPAGWFRGTRTTRRAKLEPLLVELARLYAALKEPGED